MTAPPPYFDAVRQESLEMWEQLEANPKLAAPWHQLFKQVQSPRHVVSELLQNADDAGATIARAEIQDEFFIFDHNGLDFVEEHFASLCRFGYSNKRTLHTIGFRGIGFKSTFSIGDPVELLTPSLRVAFNRERFTEPRWISEQTDNGMLTRIRVRIADIHRRRELEKNLGEWFASPVSFLFFRNIRRMIIGDKEVHWVEGEAGPVPDSRWMKQEGTDEKSVLLIRSSEEVFPDDALEEIRQERMVGMDEDAEFPPCRVEIVLGASGRLYVVLPTGVLTPLPFACNAPFIQDPARLKIKDPDLSPTNRWLLERIGALAADSMQHWLGDASLDLPTRAKAYDLVPDSKKTADDGSLEQSCEALVKGAFLKLVEKAPILMSEAGELVDRDACIALPNVVADAWGAVEAARLLNDNGRQPLSTHVSAQSRSKLAAWKLVEQLTRQGLVEILQHKSLPVPSWPRLLKVWNYVSPEITKYYYSGPKPIESIHIMPVEGSDRLHPAPQVVRLGEKRLPTSEDDWKFVSQHLLVLSSGWIQHLDTLLSEAKVRRKEEDSAGLEAATKILEKAALTVSSSATEIVDRISKRFFAGGQTLQIADCVRLARIAAKVGAKVAESFCYVTRAAKCIRVGGMLFDDPDGTLEDLVPDALREACLLHPAYRQNFSTCTEREWNEWSASARSGLQRFVAPKLYGEGISRRDQAKAKLLGRGWNGEIQTSYKNPSFVLYDWDFPEEFRKHWEVLAGEDKHHWSRVLERILGSPGLYHPDNHAAVLLEVAKNGNQSRIPRTTCRPSWSIRLSQQQCIPDTRGILRRPEELLRRTPQTEALLDIEPFVAASLDREANAGILDLIGVRSEPIGPAKIIDCLRALAAAKIPPVEEVDKWYRRLDQLFPGCSTESQAETRKAFRTERLVLTADGVWDTSKAVYIFAGDDDIPDAAVVRESVRELSLWLRLSMDERPTIERALEWLHLLPEGTRLDEKTTKRVRSLLARHPVRIWETCEHWLNLDGEWVPVSDLSYAVTMQSLEPWKHLHPEHRKKTADLQLLTDEVTGKHPFERLDLLANRIQERVQSGSVNGSRRSVEWLQALAAGLKRAEFDGEEDTVRLRKIADRLMRTSWIDADRIEIIPYIDGTPAGTARKADVAWLERELLVSRLPNGKLARLVPEEIGNAFNRREIRSALDYAFGREAVDVAAYLEENFKLVDLVEAPPETEEDPEPTGEEVPEDAPTGGTEDPEGGTSGDLSDPSSGETPGEDPPPDDTPDGEEDEEEKPERPSKPSTPKGPSLIERFAASRGFRPEGERYVHPSGEWLGKARESVFDWEKRNASGDLLRSYWIKEHCLERNPLDLNAPVWNLIKERPDLYALILTDQSGRPTEWDGSRLVALVGTCEVTLHPSSFRLVHEAFRDA